MSRTAHKNMISISTLLQLVFVMMTISPSTACPESCFCIDVFVTCSDFKFLDLTMLPPNTDTLVLTKGEVEEIPPGFLATATNLKMLEIISVSVRIVRGSAFRGLRRLDLFSITSSSFDIVEPDGFSGLTEVSKFHISDCTFGRIGKHAFGYMNNINDLRIWSSSFGSISNEAFYKLSDVTYFQFYHNNITSLGNNVFLGAFKIEDVNINMNRIQTVSRGSFEKIASAATRMVLHANTFVCSCDIAWILDQPVLEEYLEFNHCKFPGPPRLGEMSMKDISRDDLCVTIPSMNAAESTSYSSINVDVAESMDDLSAVENTSNNSVNVDVTESIDDFSFVESISYNSSNSDVAESVVDFSVVESTSYNSANVDVTESIDDFSVVEDVLDPISVDAENLHTDLMMSTSPSRFISTLYISTTMSSHLSSSPSSYSSSPYSPPLSPSSSPSSSTPISSSSTPISSSSTPISSSSTPISSSSLSSFSSLSSQSLPSLSALLLSSSSSLLSSSSSSPLLLSSESSLLPLSSPPSSSVSSYLWSAMLSDQEANSNEEDYLLPKLTSSSFPTSAASPQTSNSRPSTEESHTETSSVSSSFAALFPDTESQPVEKSDLVKSEIIKQNDSPATTTIQPVTNVSVSNVVSVHNNTDITDLADESAMGGSVAHIEREPVVERKIEHAVPYSTAAFEMAALYVDNASRMTLGSSVVIVMLNGLCLFLIRNPYL